ncbi:methylaspartate ammonia-lyase [Paraburkholderia phenoliruptrix]|uniref:methylaspartate ammonia-lyase n=1 Tax=Paraburkholderia phenoliruptrix TaxID=252970 RepID=UPI0028698C92|nr:methylaspartate ammonia-lyase [Paraburkholderia phenoliruptrix]WMY11020.1 methylaspartate ammonia-lyase [Paraburkholderia phenoliruptrix]
MLPEKLSVTDVFLAPAQGAFFYDDQLAIREGVTSDGFIYQGRPRTPGFSTIRMPAEALSIGLRLSDGVIVWGDMMSVQYAGAAGRDPVFKSDAITALTHEVVVPRLQGLPVNNFVGSCTASLTTEGDRLPLAVSYGVSQALLRAAAHASRCTMAEIICREFDLPVRADPVPLYAQSGDQRHTNVDKMVMRHVDVLPHGLINSREKFGTKGETFLEFAKWVANRARSLGGDHYNPTLHFDVYGWIGLEIGLEPKDIAAFIARTADSLGTFNLNIECPADYGSTQRQLEGYADIVRELERLGSTARIVVDEHCNTIEDIENFAKMHAAHIIQIKTPDVGCITDIVKAVLDCKAHGVGAYMGGSCVETDLSARVTTHVAVATQADMMLAKPGMGVDEGVSIVGNEQSRLLAVLRANQIKLAR